MKGDFSQWKFDPNQNFNGVLHQQGRVLLDSDWNAQTQITEDWQDTAARDAFGPGVAAVPASDRDAFKVTGITVEDGKTQVTLNPGRIWADGLLVHLAKSTTWVAPYLQQPTDPNRAGTRDAVILEVWREAINAFQLPNDLLEPALGGPDTTERVHTAMALKLYRLGAGETCETIRHKLQDDVEKKGKLTVTLQPSIDSDGDCPTTASGGYTGFEHSLYRIEIAQVNEDQPPSFKYSRFNGGLVGRGDINGETITITHNINAIQGSGLARFYLEVLAEKPDDHGHWRVTYGAEATLNEGKLDIGTEYYTESLPPSDNQFFRLWDGIQSITTFSIPESGKDPQQLPDGNGIRLAFDDPTATNYQPGDYWTFAVRVGDTGIQPLLNQQPPAGIHYHRVPLAELTWNGGASVDTEDCRRVFRPLTNQKVCCTYTVGDGVTSHGDYDSIQEAIDKLPWWGGEICVLPGIHEANVEIIGRLNLVYLKIKGCGLRSIIIPSGSSQKKPRFDKPLFHIEASYGITLEQLTLWTFGYVSAVNVAGSSNIEIGHNHILAYRHGIRVQEGTQVNIHHNLVRMLNRSKGVAAIYLQAEDAQIEHNNIGLFPWSEVKKKVSEDVPDPTEDCVAPETTHYGTPKLVPHVINHFASIEHNPSNLFKAWGGIQIASGCDRLKIIGNRINGGAANGITLGSDILDILEAIEAEPTEVLADREFTHSGGMLWGVVQCEGKGISGIKLVFRPKVGTTRKVAIRSDSRFVESEMPAGVYTVSIQDAIYKIVDIHPGDADSFWVIDVDANKPSKYLLDLLTITSEAVIENNEISNMYLSGIGTPQINLLIYLTLINPVFREKFPNVGRLLKSFASFVTLLGTISGYWINLSIHRNRIFNCWNPSAWKPFLIETRIGQISIDLKELVDSWFALRGEGGISLGLCENLSICENRIENNGGKHLDPVCGIFVSAANQTDISRNQILNNGALPKNVTALKPGIRGGIVLNLATSILLTKALEQLSTMPLALAEEPKNLVLDAIVLYTAMMGGYAVRIYDNRVEQPVGQALRIVAIGPVSVINNQFSVDFSEIPGGSVTQGNSFNPEILKQRLGQLAGAVLIVNLGLSAHVERLLAQKTPSVLLLPNGNIQFSHNQIHLGLASTAFAQVLVTLDDLNFESNQIDVLADWQQRLRINTALFASTLRASTNRFKEPFYPQPNKLSLWSASTFLNNTVDNQGDHCTFVYNWRSVNWPAHDQGNQAVVYSTCNLPISTKAIKATIKAAGMKVQSKDEPLAPV